MEQVERQLASLTGLVQTALTSAAPDKSSALSPPPTPQQQQTVHRSGEKEATPAGSPTANDKIATGVSRSLAVAHASKNK